MPWWADGLDPKAEKAKASGSEITFGAFSLEMWEDWKKAYRNDHHIWQWRHTVETYCNAFWHLPIDKVTRGHVLAALKPTWTTKYETACRVRQRIERVFDAAKAKGLRTGDNPAAWRGGLKELLPQAPKLQKKHYSAMPYRDVPAFVSTLRERRGMSALALEFIILTAARSGEVRHMVWDEIDLNAKLWTIAAHKMKAGKEHRVPLSERALAILQEVKPFATGDLVFPSPVPARSKECPLSDMAFKLLLNRMGVKEITTHGFRSSFRDWAGDETSYPREIAEAALAHQIGNEVERSYRRATALEKRRRMMEDWAEYVLKAGADAAKCRSLTH